MNPKISVIVPIYKVETYLNQCIDSILSQTFTDFELILVDDGSPDRCPEICDQYAAKDARIRLIHKENGGLSDARNAALEIARGDYITFIDSDDYVDTTMLENLYRIICSEHADIVMSNYFNVCNGIAERLYHGDETLVLNPEQAVKLVFENIRCGVMACVKLFKRQIFENIRFPYKKTSEDAYVIVDILSNASRIVYDSTPYYYYVNRPNSISTTGYTRNFDQVEAYTLNLEKVRKMYPSIINYAWFRYYLALNDVLKKMTDAKISPQDLDYLNISHIMRNNIPQILTLPVMGVKRKLMMVLLGIFPRLYYFIETHRRWE